MRATAAAATAVACLSMIAIAGVPASAAPPSDEVVTVATDLNNPRQLSIGPGQSLYVAEAGVAESCELIPGVGPEFQVCGLTGSVTEIIGGEQTRIVTGGLMIPVLWGGAMAWTLADDKILRATAVLAGAAILGFGAAALKGFT